MNSLLLKSKHFYGGLVYALNFCIGLLTVNTYAPLTEGWWHVYARWIDQGRVPYKDFELLVTPGFPYITWLFKHIVGEEFLHLRIVGLFFQAGIAFLLYLVLAKHVSSLTSVGLSTFGTTLLYSGTASISFDYNYFAVYFAILAIFFLQKDYAKQNIYIYLAGISVAGVFLIKQSTGLCLLLFISLIPFFDKQYNRSIKLLLWSKFFVGFFVPLTLVSIALILNEAFTQLIQQVFLNSSQVKGGFATILTQWIEGIYEPFGFGYATMRVFFIGILLFVIKRIKNKFSVNFNLEKYRLVFTLFIGLFIAGVTVRSRFSSTENIFRNYLEDFYLKASKYFYLEPILFILIILLWVLREKKNEWLPILMFALAMTYSTGMSAGLTEFGIFANIIVVGAWFDKILNIKALSYFILIFSLLFSSSLILKKFQIPYSWWGYTTPSIYDSSIPSAIGLTKGLKFSKKEYEEFQGIFNQLNQLKCSGEVIGYPHMPIFALESNRLPNGKAAVYWYDFISSDSVFGENERLKTTNISALFIMDMPEVRESHYRMFGDNGMDKNKILERHLKQASSVHKRIYYPNLGIYYSSCLKN